MIEPFYEDQLVTLYQGDACDLLPECESVDLVVTDPPYVLGIASTSKERESGGWGDLMNAARWYADVLGEFSRLTVNSQGAAWVFNSWRSFPVLARASHISHWPIESLLVWDKKTIGPGGPRGLRPTYELVALFAHPGFRIADRAVRDIWGVSAVSPPRKIHPAEKPVELLSRLIGVSGAQALLDPFAGSGSTLVAASSLGVRSIGFEIEPDRCEMIVDRLRQTSLSFAAAACVRG